MNGTATALTQDDTGFGDADFAHQHDMGSADSGYVTSANGHVDDVKRASGAAAETVLDNGAHGSPKIVLTSVPQNGPQNKHRSSSAGRRAIEIVQDNDEITVLVKGDVKIHSEDGIHGHDTPKRFVISSPSAPSATSTPNDKGGAGVHNSIKRHNGSGSHSLSNGKLQAQGASSDHESDVSDGEGGGSGLGTPGRARRKSMDRRGSATSPKKFAKLHNLLDEKTAVDVLHQKTNYVSTPHLDYRIYHLVGLLCYKGKFIFTHDRNKRAQVTFLYFL